LSTEKGSLRISERSVSTGTGIVPDQNKWRAPPSASKGASRVIHEEKGFSRSSFLQNSYSTEGSGGVPSYWGKEKSKKLHYVEERFRSLSICVLVEGGSPSSRREEGGLFLSRIRGKVQELLLTLDRKELLDL